MSLIEEAPTQREQQNPTKPKPNQKHKPKHQTNPTAEGIRLMIAPDVRAKGADPRTKHKGETGQ